MSAASARRKPALASVWEKLDERHRELRDLEGVASLLDWDQETVMPARGGAARARQSALIAAHRHARLTDPRVGEWLEVLRSRSGDLDPVQRSTLRNLGRAYARAVKLPERLVRETAEAKARGFQAWIQARAEGGPGFAAFAPALDRLVALARESAALIDPAAPAYDVLMDEFEPGSTTEALRPMFARLRDELGRLLAAISAARPLARGRALGRTFDPAAQRAFSKHVLREMGFDFERGRLDLSEHPFTTTFSPEDVRLTTRFQPDDLLRGLSGTVHEGGHGLFEQGFDPAHWGTAAAEAPSFGMHESQSRFWENQIGRSAAFFAHAWPKLKQSFPEALAGCTADDLYREANRVERGLIRVDADEVTYNLHIIVRFELETALFAGDLQPADLPSAWNERTRDVLGIEVPDDRSGVLQDVHWSHAAFGYFPSYTLGNLWAAGFTRRMEEDLGPLQALVRRGRFAPILAWLREHVHRPGRLDDAPARFRAVCGDRDPVTDLVDHLWARHGGLYGVARAG